MFHRALALAFCPLSPTCAHEKKTLSSLALPTIFLVALCSTLNSCKHCETSKIPQPVTVGGTGSTTVWISDGSLPCFSDTEKLQTTSGKFLGLIKTPYEALADHNVQVGCGEISGSGVGYDGEAEWVLRLPASWPDQDVTGETVVEVYGMIEVKDLGPLSSFDEQRWSRSTIGNNVLSQGVPLPIKLSDFSQMKTKWAMLEIEARDARGRTITHSADLAEVGPAFAGDGLIGYLNEVGDYWQLNATSSKPMSRWVNLSAIGSDSGYVNEAMRQGGGLLRALLPSLLKNRNLSHQAREKLVTKVLKDEEMVVAGSDASPSTMELKLVVDGKPLQWATAKFVEPRER